MATSLNSDPPHETLDELYENAPCGYVTVNARSVITRANATLLGWLYTERDALVGQHVQTILTPAGRMFFETHVAPLLSTESVAQQVALDLKCADGRRISVLTAWRSIVIDGSVLGFRIMLVDATDRRSYERDLVNERERSKDVAARLRTSEALLRELNETLEVRVNERTIELEAAHEQLRQAQKMEAVGQLTGGLAHDFNNLLAGVSGSLEMMQVRMKQGRMADVERYILMAQGAASRAAALTHRLLAFSRRQTLDPKPTNVSRLVGGMEDLIRRSVGPSIATEVVGTAGLWSVLVDPPQLENALLNLCINARDAMPNGGRITIETHNKWLDERAARERDMAPGQYLSLCVSDTGTGMSADVVSKAFDPFFTTKPPGEGTGLGLSMIYGFARQSGGQVRIYSEVGEGTNVCIYLPRHYAEELNLAEIELIEERTGAEQGGTVLVVDDEPTVRMLVTDVLKDLGYTAIEAGDSMAGLRILQSDARIDLLVTDVGLPGGMNGREMVDAARAHRRDLKILFITGYAENAVLNNGHLQPGMQMLTKPFVMETLASRIAEMMAGDRFPPGHSGRDRAQPNSDRPES